MLLRRIVLLYIVLLLCRIVFYCYNYALIGPLGWQEVLTLAGGGLKFDTVSVLYANLLFIVLSLLPFHFRERSWYRRILFWYYAVINSLLIVAVNLADCVYFRYTQKRFTSDEIFFTDNSNSAQLVLKFAAENWYLLLVGAVLIWLFVWGYGRKITPRSPLREGWVYYSVNTGLLVIAILLGIAGMRGGVTRMTRPITLSNATLYASTSEKANLILSNPFCILRTIGSGGSVKYTRYFSPEKLDEYFTPTHRPDSSAVNLEGRNVMVFILESMSAEHSAYLKPELYGNGTQPGYTPFLDSLMRQSLCFGQMYANGTRSIQAMPAVLGSIPSFKQPFVLMPQSLGKSRQLPQILRDKGYRTAFFCGSERGSMGFGAYARSAGIDRLLSREDYEAAHGTEDFDGYWGIWDEPFLQFTGEELSKMQEPFFATLFTLSSHHPFVVPEQYADKLPAGTTKIHKPVAYEDLAFRNFYRRFKDEEWFRRTIFVFVADHVSSEKMIHPHPRRRTRTAISGTDRAADRHHADPAGTVGKPGTLFRIRTRHSERTRPRTVGRDVRFGIPGRNGRSALLVRRGMDDRRDVPKRDFGPGTDRVGRKSAQGPDSTVLRACGSQKLHRRRQFMITFKPITIEDKAEIESFTLPYAPANCDLAFANMFCWQFQFKTAWSVVDGFLVIRFQIGGSDRIGYMQPVGAGDFTPVLRHLEEDILAAGQRLRIIDMTPEGLEKLRSVGHCQFAFASDRNLEDYVYNASDLRDLPGRKYQSKRNHINRFEAEYEYRYEPMTRDHAAECMRLEAEWRKTRSGHTGELSAEQRAMQRAFAHFDRLGLIGGCIYVGDKLVAFTYGSPINDHTFCVHVEKADTEYDGAFTIINREFVAHLPEQYTLIDREEDLGIPGLRQAKLSYHPAFLEKKYTALCLYPDEIACKRLWIKCFGDEETFIDSFLIGHYSRKRMLAAEEDGRLAAMLHLIPFESELGRTTYIYGVATDPDYRGRGLASGLMREAMRRIAEEGADAAILIPSQESLKDFYAPFGFEDRSLPVVFEAPDDFDFGSGNQEQDRAMVWRRNNSAPLPERLHCRLL